MAFGHESGDGSGHPIMMEPCFEALATPDEQCRRPRIGFGGRPCDGCGCGRSPAGDIAAAGIEDVAGPKCLG